MFEFFYKNRLLNTIGTLFFTAIFFVSPLIFFTDLTRNPYYFQITLLNISVLAIFIAVIIADYKDGGLLVSKNILNLPFIILIFIFLFSSLYSLLNHNDFFHPAMISESLKKGVFTTVNCFLVFYISQNIPFGKMPEKKDLFKWTIFFILWPLFWLFFPTLKSGAPSDLGIISKFWDPYGGILWIVAIIIVMRFLRKFRQQSFIHLALIVCSIASLYGILQYFQIELIWKKALNPYGNRSVSTFGNPNFISSFIVMLFPIATAYLLYSKTLFEKFFYAFIFLTYEGMLLSSLTRSSWIGAFAGIVFIFGFKEFRNKFVENRKFTYPFLIIVLVFLFFWPSENLKPFSSGMADRVSEGALKTVSSKKITLNVEKDNVYNSLHQRLLIWSSAWQMGLENPALGKGWGNFELFYPFYQGPLLGNFEGIRGLRTHANNAHNEILELWSQTGIIGLGAYIWVFLTLLICFMRFYKKAVYEDRYWTIPFLAALSGMFIDNMLNVSLHFAVPAFLFWWIVGALSLKLSSPDGSPKYLVLILNKNIKNLISLSLVLLCFVGIYYWHSQFMREIHYFKGFKLMRKARFSQAVDELKKAYSYHGREVNNNYEFANAYVRMDDYPKAQWAYQESLKSNCGYDEIFFNFAVVNKKLRKFDLALENLKMSILINPINIANYTALAEIFMSDIGKYSKEGALFFENALRIFPFDANIINTLGYFLTTEKNYKRAKEVYARGVKINPANEMLVSNLKMVAERLKVKNDSDIKWLAQYKDLENSLKGNNYTKDSLDIADALLQDAPYSAAVMYLKSKILFVLGEYSLSKKCLEKILKINPENADARYGLGNIFEKEGNCEAAKKEFIEVFKSNPGNDGLKARLKKMPC
ncbi:MAG: O-antigen ligase family protein [Elusimicrobia bacterium]|nr:O-antigen ligase family protein [Elusimicrobiota bacterium]